MNNKREEIIVDVIAILRDILGEQYKEEIRLDDNLAEDLGFDSIMAIRSMVEFEKTFKISLVENSDQINLMEITKVDDLVRLVDRFT